MSERRPLWEMFMKPVFASFVLLAVAFGAALAKPENLKPLKTWKGSVADEALEKTAPTVIVSQKTLDAVWEQWKQPGKAPTVDFDKELIAVTTSRGSIVNLILMREDKNLKVLGFGTRDLRDGFRFVMGTTPRAGIETVNSVALPKE